MKKVLGMHVHPFREGDKERYGLELKFTDKFSFLFTISGCSTNSNGDRETCRIQIGV